MNSDDNKSSIVLSATPNSSILCTEINHPLNLHKRRGTKPCFWNSLHRKEERETIHSALKTIEVRPSYKKEDFFLRNQSLYGAGDISIQQTLHLHLWISFSKAETFFSEVLSMFCADISISLYLDWPQDTPLGADMWYNPNPKNPVCKTFPWTHTDIIKKIQNPHNCCMLQSVNPV